MEQSVLEQGVAHHRDGRLGEAERCYLAARAAQPERLETLANLATLYVQTNRLDAAEECWRAIVAAHPDLAAAHNNLGATLRSLRRPAEAVACFADALRLQPVYPEARNNLGAALCELARFEEALPHFLAAIEAQPNYAKALCNLGSALRDLHRFEEALAALHHALRFAPDFAEAHYNAAQVLLLTGRLAEGWAEFEWRAFLPQAARRAFAAPAWRGGPTDGRRLLIHAEEGLGDTIQFCRFVPRLIAAGHRVTFEAQPPLARLLGGVAGAGNTVAAGGAPPPHDLHCPLLSLPLVLGVTEADLGDGAPYLTPDPAAVTRWRRRVAGLQGRAVGVAWAGNPGYLADLRRSLPEGALAPLATAGDVAFVSLQKGDAPGPGLGLHDWTDELTDMAETAALVACLDLVIAVDTAVAHLAGALGTPVWLLNRYDTDWRWRLERDDTPWYRSMRIFRQSAPGDWPGVVARVAEALRAPATSAPARARPAPAPAAIGWRSAETLDRLATQAVQAGDFEAAAALGREALALRPDAPWLHNNHANALRSLGRLDEALSLYRQSEAIEPGQAAVRCNIGNVLKELGQLDDAEAAYRAAIGADADFSEAHTALGALLLEDGRFEEGWRRFAWRKRLPRFNLRALPGPGWDGAPGTRTVLLHSDEGLGDAIQFCRFVPRVAARAGDVVLETPAPLARLFAGIPGVRHLTQGEPLPPFDAHAPLLDLALLLDVRVPDLPGTDVPYLTPPPDRAAHWAARLRGLPARRVGLVWAGNRDNPADRLRSLPLPELAPLFAACPEIGFVSLQKDGGRAGLDALPPGARLHDWTGELTDMAETAALIANLDLVIAVDTSVAHLAGALGRPVWLLNRRHADWRWLRGRADSPWYPSMRIFAQSRPLEWGPVIDAVIAALRAG